jgi:phage shock protein A
MGILKKIVTAFRGHATEVGEAIVDANALTILDQEIRDAKESLNKSRTNLTSIMAERQIHLNRVNDYKSSIEKLTASAEAALEKGEEALALEVAERIASEQADMDVEQGLVDQFDQSVNSLKASIREAEQQLKHLEQQVNVVKATENVQKAQASVAARHSGQETGMRTALDSLDRIKARQEKRGAQIQAANQLAAETNGDSLDAKLKAAGIGTNTKSAQDILAGLRKKETAE